MHKFRLLLLNFLKFQRNNFEQRWERLILLTGIYSKYEKIDLSRVNRFVFVCKGNVCRSPYAEAVGKKAELSCVSCGIDVTVAAPAEAMARDVARLKDLDLRDHASKSIYSLTLYDTDCVIVMEHKQLNVVELLVRDTGCQVALLGLWRHPQVLSIADPYGGSGAVFERCFSQIDEAVSNLCNAYKSR